MHNFQNCDALEKISLNENVVLMPHAFEDCGRLGTVEFEEGFDGFGPYEYAFSGCTALHRVICGDAVWDMHFY